MDKKSMGIVILALSSVLLMAMYTFVPAPVEAAAVMKDRDYQLVTAPVTGGGEALYLTDNRTGLVAVFIYDAGQRAVVVKSVQPISDMFRVR